MIFYDMDGLQNSEKYQAIRSRQQKMLSHKFREKEKPAA
jgi:hypothetical protein